MAVIGIDLGTTYSAAAVLHDGTSVQMIPNEEGLDVTPSVVFFPDTEDSEEPLVGSMAKNSAASAPYNTVQFIKREMGNDSWLYTSPNGTDFRPEEVSALLLSKIKSFAELHLGREVNDVVITVPAYFDDARRTATKQAGTMAGLNVLRVLNEPTAAAIAFGLQAESSGRVLVYDLGGGTFDITLMDIRDGDFDVIATDGNPNLGGFDFDNTMKELIVEDLRKQEYEVDEFDDFLHSEIREKSEILKRSLTSAQQSTAVFTIDGKTYRVKVSREQFEDATKPLLKQTSERLEIMMEDVGVQWDDIDHLVMIGGSTRMPMVKRMLEQMSGKTLRHEVNPDEAVALGAAIYASALSGGSTSVQPISISDVTSQSLGTIALDDNQELYNSIIIQRNSKIPSKSSKVYSTVSDNQRQLNIEVTEGNDSELEYVNILGKKCIDIPPYPKGAPVKITFAYDIDQTVFVEVYDLTADKLLGTFDIDRRANLTSGQVNEMRKKLSEIPKELDD